MPTPRQAARSLAKTATRLERVTDPIVKAAGSFAVDRAIDVGGNMISGRYRLIAEVDKVSNRKGRSTALVLGKPPGFWAIKSYGRRGGYSVRGRSRPLNLRGAGIVRGGRQVTAAWGASPGRARGDNRWEREVVEGTNDEFVTIAAGLVEEAIDG